MLHCHIFKNAGSSVDLMLKANFGSDWMTAEFPVRSGLSNSDLTNTFIRSNEGCAAVSTHTGDWWLDHSDDELAVLPIVFLRHPLLRIRSAYSFERTQRAETVGALLAKAHDFPGYVRARLERGGDYAFRDFQARRLAAYQSRMVPDLRSTAFRALERAPFIGLVEDFDASARRMQDFLAPHFEGFRGHKARVNITDYSETTSEQKLDRIREELGEALHSVLLDANAIDLEIYEAALLRWGTPAPVAAPVSSTG